MAPFVPASYAARGLLARSRVRVVALKPLDVFLRGRPRTPVEWAQGRLLVGLNLAFAAIAGTFAWHTWHTGLKLGVTLTCVAGMLLFAGLLMVLRSWGRQREISLVFCLLLQLLIFVAAWSSAGAVTLCGPWMLMVPVLSTYLVGLRLGVATAFLTIGGALGLLALETTGIHSPSAEALAYLGDSSRLVVSGAVVQVLLITVAALYHAAQHEARSTIERTAAELVEARERAAQTEKMAAVGQLAAGLAHEINNPLGVILGFAQGAERRLSPGDGLTKPIASIVREALRCRSLVQELLAFSRRSSACEPIDVNDAVRSTSRLLEARARLQGVEVECTLERDLPLLRWNRTQLQQVIVNLGTNALDAMAKGGRLTFRTCLSTPDRVTIEVEDTGTGIAPELRTRIFEPFFTTKEVGKGTGLGLSLVHELVQQRGGGIDVRSRVGEGTVMSVKLPVHESAAA